MSKHYTDELVRAVGLTIDATMPVHGSDDDQITYAARAVLDAVAPAIAARALREAADDMALRLSGHSGVSVKGLRFRADEIEAGR